ncbi:MAG: TMEM175 family protein [Planctomycetota bacterium]
MTSENKYMDPKVPLQRLGFIIDMVFAIAMVSFAIVFPWPQVDRTAANPLLHLLSNEALSFISLGLTYSIVAMFWYKHAVQFGYLRRVDAGQVILQFTYTFGIIILPLSVWLTLAMYEFKLSLIIHNINMIWLGFFSIMAWNQATRDNRLVDKELPAEVITSTRRAALLEPGVMAIGILAALIGPVWWMLSFLLLVIIPVAQKAFEKKR